MSNDMNSWPPALKEWVTACFAKMTDANRAEAQAELKEVIADAYGKKKLWEIDWKSVELASLSATKPTPLKRKLTDTPKKSSKKFQISEEQAAKAKRARRFEREHELERQRNNGVSTSLVGINGISSSASLSSRLGPRFMGAQEDVEDITMADPNVIDWDRYTIVGCSTSLFKNYLRLTSEPDPKDIRPLHILVETLAELKRRWKRDNDYPWICDQFKSLRQDLTVQRIKTEFTVQVYEIHARMALENADLVEYNQCQATLRQLYELGIPGKNDEFTAYRILYMIHARNRAELNFLVGRLTDEQKAVPAIRHALDVQTALATSNYHAFFALFLKAPNMGGYIMDHFVERERVRALMVMCKAYVTGVPLSFIATELALDSATQVHELLAKHNASFYIDASLPDQDKIFNGKMAFQALFDSYHTKFRKVGIRGSI